MLVFVTMPEKRYIQKRRLIKAVAAPRSRVATSTLQQELGGQDTGAGQQDAADGGNAALGARLGDGRGRGGASGGRRVGAAGGGGSGVARARVGLGGSGDGRGQGRLGLDAGRLGDGAGRRLGRRGLGGLGAGLGGLGGAGDARGAAGVIVAAAADNLDALPGAGVVRVDVLLDTAAGGRVLAGIVDDLDALVVGEEGSLGVVGVAAGPLDSALRSILAAGDPGSELDLHGRLGKGSGTTLGVGGRQLANLLAVDEPPNALRRPLDGVSVNLASGVADAVEGTTVVAAGITLAEVVGLNLGVVAANPLPVDLNIGLAAFLPIFSAGIPYLIEIIRLENSAGDDTLAGGGLNLDFDLAEEDVLAGVDGRGVAVLGDAEDGTLAVVLQAGAIGQREGVASTLGEVTARRASEGRVGRAGCGSPCQHSYTSTAAVSGRRPLTLLQGVAGSESLGGDKRRGGKGHRGHGKGLGHHVCGRCGTQVSNDYRNRFRG